MRRRTTWKDTLKSLVRLVLWAVIIFVILLPLWVIFSTAVKTIGDVFNSPATWIPRPLVLRNLIDVWSFLPNLRNYYLNSIKLSLGTTIYSLLLVIPAAFAISKARFRGKTMMIFLVLWIQMFSPVMIVLPLFKILDRLHLLDQLLGLVLVDSVFGAAFSTWLLSGFFDAIPENLDRAAIMDGCTSIQVLRHIYVPLATPGLVVTSIYIFIRIWNEFLFAYTFISSDAKNVFSVGIVRLFSVAPDHEISWHMIMSASVFSIIPVTVLFMFIRRYLMRGLLAGAVKG